MVFVSMFASLLICFVVLFRFYSLFIFIHCLCYVTVLYHFFYESIRCSKMKLSYSVCLLIDCILKIITTVHNAHLIRYRIYSIFCCLPGTCHQQTVVAWIYSWLILQTECCLCLFAF